MADIVYRYPEMKTAMTDVDNYASQYKTAAETLESDILSAITNWEGESKDKFVSFLIGAVKEHLQVNIPAIVGVVAREIETSADEMSKTDADLAANIPQSLG